jgi:hypothetical protein
MKTKYSSNRELIHVWANDPNPTISKSANSMSCYNGKLFSYSTCIAQIVDNTVIHNTYGYSVTTSKQQGLAGFASRHYSSQIYLEFPQRGLDHLLFNQSDFDNFVLKHNKRLIEEALIKASRSRKYSDQYKATALRIIGNLTKYALFYKLSYTVPNTDDLTESALKADKEAKALEKIRIAERIKQQTEALANWRKGDDVRNHFEVTALRIKDDVIETSRGARIPLEHAVKFWGLIKAWHEKGTSYVKSNHSIHLGNYAVNRFENDILTVGCHQIPYSEIQNIANQLHLN